jgi:hypothetical protein
MTHRTLPVDWEDDPCPIVLIDRRNHPDRRVVWRGGRRDCDWTSNRPPGAIERLSKRDSSLLGWRWWPLPREA